MDETVAWVMQQDGTALAAIAVRPIVWPGQARVTYTDGAQATEPLANVRAADDLDTRWVPH